MRCFYANYRAVFKGPSIHFELPKVSNCFVRSNCRPYPLLSRPCRAGTAGSVPSRRRARQTTGWEMTRTCRGTSYAFAFRIVIGPACAAVYRIIFGNGFPRTENARKPFRACRLIDHNYRRYARGRVGIVSYCVYVPYASALHGRGIPYSYTHTYIYINEYSQYPIYIYIFIRRQSRRRVRYADVCIRNGKSDNN